MLTTQRQRAILEKVAQYRALEKQALFETLRVGAKALKQAFFGGRALSAASGVLQAEREAAVRTGGELISKLEAGGLHIHRARVKSPGSIMGNGGVGVPNDLLGMQAYARSPEEAASFLRRLKEHGVEVQKSQVLTRPGYHGINAKGVYQNTPFELQLSPSRMSNVGQMMEHSLGYKSATEAPRSNFIDRWFGRKVAPKMVEKGSWLPTARTNLAQLGVGN